MSAGGTAGTGGAGCGGTVPAGQPQGLPRGSAGHTEDEAGLPVAGGRQGGWHRPAIIPGGMPARGILGGIRLGPAWHPCPGTACPGLPAGGPVAGAAVLARAPPQRRAGGQGVRGQRLPAPAPRPWPGRRWHGTARLGSRAGSKVTPPHSAAQTKHGAGGAAGPPLPPRHRHRSPRPGSPGRSLPKAPPDAEAPGCPGGPGCPRGPVPAGDPGPQPRSPVTPAAARLPPPPRPRSPAPASQLPIPPRPR